jgi:Cu2+-exporting ATPase
MDDKPVAVFGLEDQIRSDAVETVQKLRARGISMSLISGDHEGAVSLVASRLRISGRSRCTPASKAEYVKSLIDEGNTVLFIGDGTNDAVALAQASIGLHMNTGTDVAQSAADAILMRPSLTNILTLIDLSRAFHRRVLFNFGWSFVYNLFAILLAAGAFEATEAKASIQPQYAGLGELVSVLPVILVAVSLRWVNF